MPGGAARIILTRGRSRHRVEIAAQEMGMGTATVQTQVIAERLGLPLEQVTLRLRRLVVPGAGRWPAAPQQTASIGAAVIAASAELVKELLKLAGEDSPLAGLGRRRSRSARRRPVPT